MCIFPFSWFQTFRCVLNVICFLLGNSPASEFYMPTFRITLSPSFLLAQAVFEPNLFPRMNTPTFSTPFILHNYPPMKMEQTKRSETSAYKIQTPGNYPEESIQYFRFITVSNRQKSHTASGSVQPPTKRKILSARVTKIVGLKNLLSAKEITHFQVRHPSCVQ